MQTAYYRETSRGHLKFFALQKIQKAYKLFLYLDLEF